MVLLDLEFEMITRVVGSGAGKFHLFYGGNKQELTVISNSTQVVN